MKILDAQDLIRGRFYACYASKVFVDDDYSDTLIPMRNTPSLSSPPRLSSLLFLETE